MLQYLLALFFIASYCMAIEQPRYKNFLQDKEECQNEKLSKTEQFLCMYGQGFNPMMRTLYVTGSSQWKMRKLADLLDKGGSDYILTPGIGAHKLHVRKVSWGMARRICNKEGGHLTVINSNSEENILLRILHDLHIDKAWVGVHDIFQEAEWLTILDQPMEQAGWAKWAKLGNLPDNLGNKQHCGLLWKEGGIDDFDCSRPFPFFCELNL